MPADQPEWILDARYQVGRRVQARRMHQNLTQEQMRDLTGLSVDTIQRIEAGGDPKISQLFLLARALNVHVTDLLV